MLILKKPYAGFTLVELMVTLVISAFVFIVLMSLFLTNANHYQKTISANKLNQQLESIIDVMANEIRRAGYWSNASSNINLGTNNNPFMAGSADISVDADNNCILFTYDHNLSGSLPSIGSGSDDDRYGFRLSDNAVLQRPSGASFSCTGNDWEKISDTKIINVTALTFTLNTSTFTTGPGSKGLSMRSIDISITGSLVVDPTISKTLTHHVKIRNDKFIP